MKILRLLFMVLLIVAILAGFGWLATQKGEIAYTGGAIDISVKPVIAAVALLLSAIALAALWGLIAWMIALPAKMKKAALETNRKKSLELIGSVLSSHDAGDYTEARKLAQKLYSIAPSEPTNKLIFARASMMADDFGNAEKLFGELSEINGFQSAALKGLSEISSQKGNFAAAISHANNALNIAKKSVWPLETIFKEKINNSDWEGAIATLDEAEKRGLVGKKTAQRRRAVVLAANAHRLEKASDYNGALDCATRALKLAPSFAPAAIMAARLYKLAGKDWQAAQALESAWSFEPHPALALAYKDLKEGKSKKDILKWAEGLVKLRPEHRESRILQVEDAIANNEYELAKSILDGLLKEKPTSRILALCAQASLLKNDTASYDDYMHKAAVAPREADWSDLDPEGKAFDYRNEDWAALVEAYGEGGLLIHPRLEHFNAAKLIKPEDAPALTNSVAELASPQEPGADALNYIGEEAEPKKSWLGF